MLLHTLATHRRDGNSATCITGHHHAECEHTACSEVRGVGAVARGGRRSDGGRAWQARTERLARTQLEMQVQMLLAAQKAHATAVAEAPPPPAAAAAAACPPCEEDEARLCVVCLAEPKSHVFPSCHSDSH